MEAVPRAKLNGITLDEFEQKTKERNSGKSYGLESTNSYVAWGRNEIRFDIRQENPILKTGIDSFDQRNTALSNWPLVQDDILNSEGHSGFITITNPHTKEKLNLDFRDVKNPIRQ